MNPFSKLRSTIKSRVFDAGIVEMAKSFNNTALAEVLSFDGIGGQLNAKITDDSLAWM